MGQEELQREKTTSVTPKRKQTLSYLYRSFRESGLKRIDSFFNALYICQTNKHYNINSSANEVENGFFSHPAGYYVSKAETVRRSSKAKILKALERVAKILAPVTKSVQPIKRRLVKRSDIRPKKSFSGAIPVLLAVAVAAGLYFSIKGERELTAVIEVRVDGVLLGEVASAKTVDSALSEIVDRMVSAGEKAYTFPHEITFAIKKEASSKALLSKSDMVERLTSYVEGELALGYGLYVDSRLVAVLENEDDITSVLDDIREEHVRETGHKGEDIANHIEIVYKEYLSDSVISKDTLITMFAPVDSTPKEEAPQRDLLLSGIPGRETTFQATENELLEKLNGAASGDAIVLDFGTTVEETLRENIPYKTEYITDDDAYEGQEIVVQKGRDGRASNTYSVTFTNGVETGRVLIEQNITREPTPEIIKVGTKTLPETMSEEENGGKYMINPVPSAYVSSKFGWRVLNGKSDHHDGLDLAALQGESIYAAASGEVIFAGYNSSYGNHIKIRHADGKVTLYGHCYKLFVKTGETVKQAQKIAEVGNTGYSFGNHCHFEVYVNGERVNPEKYLYSLD